jgi:hypothetical protein
MGKITPGERAHNWSQALVTLWPIILALLGGAVYGNSETVRNWIHGAQLEPVGEVKVPTHDNFDQQTITAINQIIEVQKKHAAEIAKIRSHTNKHDSDLQNQINKWHGNGK